MAGVVRVNDQSNGHGCFPPVKAVKGSSKVTVGGRQVIRVGDVWESHKCPDSNIQHPNHDVKSSTGSSKVTIGGVPLCRVSDKLSCGDIIATGSTKVSVK